MPTPSSSNENTKNVIEIPNAENVFSGWSADTTDTINQLTVSMTASRIINANFVKSSVPPLIDQLATQETKNLWNYMYGMYGKNVITGIWEKPGLNEVKQISGKTAAILGQDMSGWHPHFTPEWHNAMKEQRQHLIDHYNNGGIVQVNWHWSNPFNSEGAWSSLTDAQWKNLVLPGTSEYNMVMAEIDLHVENFLKHLKDSNGIPIPILFRPLHEIDGGWFWWTNKTDPGKTVTLYKMVFDRIKNHHQLHNLIWVWNNSEVAETAQQSGEYYPGNQFADIVGIDLYHIDYQTTGRRYKLNQTQFKTYRDYWNILSEIAPGKPKALCEGDALPNGTNTANNNVDFPKWMYALAWWSPSDGNGSGECHTSPCNSSSWVNETYNHGIYITLDEMATNGSCATSSGNAEK